LAPSEKKTRPWNFGACISWILLIFVDFRVPGSSVVVQQSKSCGGIKYSNYTVVLNMPGPPTQEAVVEQICARFPAWGSGPPPLPPCKVFSPDLSSPLPPGHARAMWLLVKT